MIRTIDEILDKANEIEPAEWMKIVDDSMKAGGPLENIFGTPPPTDLTEEELAKAFAEMLEHACAQRDANRKTKLSANSSTEPPASQSSLGIVSRT
jgi:hypothetical protein